MIVMKRVMLIGPPETCHGYADRCGILAAAVKFEIADDYLGADSAPSESHLIAVMPGANLQRRDYRQLTTLQAPLLLSLSEFATADALAGLAKLCDKNKQRLYLSLPLRFHSGIARLKEILSTGVLGQLHRLRLTRTGHLPFGVGIMANFPLTLHDLDLCQWLAGPVIANSHTVTNEPDKGRAEVTMATTGGGQVQLTVEVKVDNSVASTACGFRIEITTEHGHLRYVGPDHLPLPDLATVERTISLPGLPPRTTAIPVPACFPEALELAWLLQTPVAYHQYGRAAAKEVAGIIEIAAAMRQ